MKANRRGFLKALGIGGATAATVSIGAVAAKPALKLPTESGRNPFDIPTEIVPKGMKYEWKRVFIDGEQHDMSHLADMVARGWSPVPVSRHREVFGSDFHNWVEVGGLVLMEKSLAAIKRDAPIPEPLPFKETGITREEWMKS